MTITSDGARFAIVEEVNAGAIPVSPVFDVMRLTGEGISFEYDSTQSEELGGVGRGVKDSILTGGSASGDLNFELHYAEWLNTLLSATLGSDWGDDPLTLPITADQVYVTDTRRTFTIEKDWLKEDGGHLFHRYTGNISDALSLSITPNEPITGSFTMLGTTLVTSESALAGATYTDAGTNPIMTAPLVTGITVTDQLDAPLFAVDTSCWTNMTISVLNNARGIPCIGTLGNREVVLGRFEGTLDYAIYFESNDMLDLLVDQTELKVTITCTDADGASYVLFFPRVKVSTAEIAAGGTGEDVLVEGQMTILTGTAPDTYGMMITRDDNIVIAAANKPTQQPSEKQPDPK